jgi:hypothetical protein
MSDEVLQKEPVLSVCPLLPSYCVVVADGEVVYEGTDQVEVSSAFFRAGKGGAKCVACFVNGVKVTYSRAVTGA